VKDIQKYMTSEPDILSAPPDVAYTTPVGRVTKASVEELEDPFIVYAYLDYKSPEAFEEGIKGWKRVVSNTDETEDFVPVYMCLRDNKVENRIRMVEAYNDKQAFDKHCATAVVGKKMGDEATLKAAEPYLKFLKKISGFWYK
jgi:quinol monooxygenase YgiN